MQAPLGSVPVASRRSAGGRSGCSTLGVRRRCRPAPANAAAPRLRVRRPDVPTRAVLPRSWALGVDPSAKADRMSPEMTPCRPIGDHAGYRLSPRPNRRGSLIGLRGTRPGPCFASPDRVQAPRDSPVLCAVARRGE